jgi:CheY-like chemotaxis protein
MKSMDNHGRKNLERSQPVSLKLGERLPLTILIAEDNLINQKLLKSILEKQGYKPDTVADGNEVLDIVLEKNYDLILMDIQMPELGGEETTRKVRELMHENTPKIIAVTAYAMAGDRKKYLDAGMDGYLSKPFKIDELIAEISRVMDGAGN